MISPHSPKGSAEGARSPGHENASSAVARGHFPRKYGLIGCLANDFQLQSHERFRGSFTVEERHIHIEKTKEAVCEVFRSRCSALGRPGHLPRNACSQLTELAKIVSLDACDPGDCGSDVVVASRADQVPGTIKEENFAWCE